MEKIRTHVVPREKGWAVRKEGTSRASRTFEKQTDAIKYARSQAQKNGAVLYVHARDGMIVERRSYGDEPRTRTNVHQ